MSEETKIDRGVRAERLLSDPMLAEGFAAVREAVLAKFEASPVRDTEGRERLFLMLKALNDVKGHLEQAVREGKFAVKLRDEKRRFQIFSR
jgi:hypothetical protein